MPIRLSRSARPGKRRPTDQQKQIRFLLVIFAALMILLLVVALWFFSGVHIPSG